MKNSSNHPKGLYVLFATEMWERFSYYGMRAIFVLYMVKALVFNKELASGIYGSYTGLVFLTPLLGGYIADHYWGNRRSILNGGLIMALGQFFMFLSASFFLQKEFALPLMYAGLTFLIIGNGFFKPNISTMVGQLYEEKEKARKDSAYTIFYMGINIGAFFAPLVAGTLGDTGNPADFKWGFLSASIGMLIGTTIFQLLQHKYLVTSAGQPIGIKPNRQRDEVKTANSKNTGKQLKELSLWGVGEVVMFFLFYKIVSFDFFGSAIFSFCLIVPAYIITDKSLSKIERQRIWVIFIISFFVIFFWAAFEQAGASLTFFADEQTDRVIFGKEMPASYFQVFGALFVVLLAPVLSFLWLFLKRKNIEISSPVKQAIGLFLLAIGYLVIAFGVKDIAPEMKVSMLWLISLYFIHALGELCLSPIGLSLVNQLAPVRFASLLMAVWFLSSSTANKFAGVLSALYPEFDSNGNLVKATSFIGFQIENLFDFFMVFVVMAGIASILLFAITGKLEKMMHQNEEVYTQKR